MSGPAEPGPPESLSGLLTARGLLATTGRWALRWSAVGALLGAFGMCWIVFPYTDFLAQFLIRGTLGAVLGALIGVIGGALDEITRRKMGGLTFVLALVLMASGVFGIFAVGRVLLAD